MSEASTANLALGRLGISKAIAALTDRTPEAITCNRFFDQCRQEVLRAFPWSFALSATLLAQVADQVFPGWAYVYQYPSGCLRMGAVSDQYGLRLIRTWNWSSWDDLNGLAQTRWPWQIALRADGASQVILSDVATSWGFYTADVPNTGAWPADFTSVVAWRLAMEIGGPLSAKADLITAAEARYGAWFSRAAATSMNESRDDSVPESPSIACRM